MAKTRRKKGKHQSKACMLRRLLAATGEGRPLTQEEVAERLGISRMRVSQIEDAALKKMRKIFHCGETKAERIRFVDKLKAERLALACG